MKIGDTVNINFDPAGLPLQGVVTGFQRVATTGLIVVETGIGPLVVPTSLVSEKVGYTVGTDHDDTVGGTTDASD